MDGIQLIIRINDVKNSVRIILMTTIDVHDKLFREYSKKQIMNGFAQNSDLQNMATDIFNDKILTVPKTVRNFIVLIPNEAHESPLLPEEKRLINQPYVPQSLVVDPQTNIIWFSGDVGHVK
ncbi:MAG: hypothetical protein ABR515_04280 [Nitrososphaeraceae archaeon]